jgi:RNA polymerase sigma-70 factor, ECF subfamily
MTVRMEERHRLDDAAERCGGSHEESRDVALCAVLANGRPREGSRALEDIYHAHGSMAYGLAFAITGEPADADEVVGDTFLQVWKSADRFDSDRAGLAGWIAIIARSRALDFVRARERRSRTLERAARRNGGALAASLGSPPRLPDAAAEVGEVRRIVRHALTELPAPQREVIRLSYMEGLSHREIAATLGEPLGTVKTRIRTGLRRLQRALHPLAGKLR